tara:strand:+ start:1038 stop:1643 length:606 start_codon:yes stop_codon:yes gene_type:complete
MDKITLLSREQEKKKVFFQLGKKFKLPLDIIIFLYNTLRKSVYHDRLLQINFHKNILSSHLCGPSSLLDFDVIILAPNNPFDYRLPLGKGNEWLIKSDVARKDNIIYHGLYNGLKPRDIINQQIQIYGETNFILKYNRWCAYTRRVYYEPLTGMERIRFIDHIGIDLFDIYLDHLEDPDYNIERVGDSFEEILDDNYYHEE